MRSFGRSVPADKILQHNSGYDMINSVENSTNMYEYQEFI